MVRNTNSEIQHYHQENIHTSHRNTSHRNTCSLRDVSSVNGKPKPMVITKPTHTHIQFLRPGMKVLGNFNQEGVYYPGKLGDVKGDKCTIHYDDGDVEYSVSTGRLCFMPMQTTKKLSIGAHVLVSNKNCYDVGIVESQQKSDVTVRTRNMSKTVPKQTVTVGELG